MNYLKDSSYKEYPVKFHVKRADHQKVNAHLDTEFHSFSVHFRLKNPDSNCIQ